LETVVSFDVTASVAFAHADASSTRSLLATLLLGLAAVGASLLQTRPASFDELQVLLRCHCRLLLFLFVAGFLLGACVALCLLLCASASLRTIFRFFSAFDFVRCSRERDCLFTLRRERVAGDEG